MLPGYEVLSLLGNGSMGAVYLALQTSLDRPVAIKVLPLEISADPEFSQRFVQEARAMARLSHPHITPVHDFGKTGQGQLYYVMEFVDGASLQSVIQAGRLSAERALEIAGQVCDALHCAHQQGIVHRDIKPANVLVEKSGRVKVTDFGIARLVEPGLGGLTLTHAGRVFGTPDYLSPEQSKGLAVDHRADIFSLGVMLYEMLCGEVPRGAFPPPSRVVRCGTRVDALVLKAMQQAPTERFQSTQEMKAQVEALSRRPHRNAPHGSRRWLLFVPGLGALGAAAFFLWPENGKGPAPPAASPVTPAAVVRSSPTQRETAEWFFSVGDSLSHLTVTMPDGSVLNVESVEQLPEGECTIVELWFDRLKSTPADPPATPEDFVRHMAPLTGLKSVFFRYHTLLKDEHFAFLAANPRLDFVTLEGIQVTDAVLDHLRGLKNLRSLNISGDANSRCRFSGRGMDRLACRPVLTQFAVPGTSFDDLAAQQLPGFPNLRTVSLSNTSITDSSVNALRQLPAVEALLLENTGVTDAGAVLLTSMTRLKRLAVDNLAESTLEALRKALPDCHVGPQE